MLNYLWSLFDKEPVREEVMEDARWLLFLASALALLTGLFLAVHGWAVAFFHASAAVLLFAGALIPFFWVRLGAIAVCVTWLTADFAFRKNFVSLFFMVIFALSLIRLIRCLTKAGKERP